MGENWIFDEQLNLYQRLRCWCISVSGFAHGSNIYNNITGTVIINNTTGSNLTLYYWTQGLGTWNGGSTSALFSNFGGSGWGENSIVAYPMN